MTFTAYIFPKLRSAKDMVRLVSKRPRLGTPFDSKHANRSQTLPESAR